MWNNCPIAETTALILRSVFRDSSVVCRAEENKNADLRVCSYFEDFDYLWKFDEEFYKWLEQGNRKLVVVWDKTPRDSFSPVNISDYITAFDWAVALSLNYRTRQNKPTTKPTAMIEIPWQLMIVDLASNSHNNSRSVQLFSKAQKGTSFLPWVSVKRPTDLNSVAEIYSVSPNVQSVSSDLELIRHLWISLLTMPANPGDRHAITNLIGPQILLSGMGLELNQDSAYTSPALSALRNLLHGLGLVPSDGHKETVPWVSASEWKQLNPKFILLDDMHELGWADFLRGALGIATSDNQRLAVFFNPTATEFGPERNKTLLDLLQDDNGKLRIKQGLRLVPGNEAPIIFLDLRLFAGRSEEEFKFLGDLLPLARQAREEDQNSDEFPWTGFTSDEIKAVERCLRDREIETSDYYTALTLLPRLISIVDPMLPVVLFSSTGQRRIVDSLKSYGNIITDFDKPRFFGELSSTVVTETKNRFQRAVETGFEIIRGRRAYQSLEIYAKTASAPTVQNNQSLGWAEIYFDESGSHPGAKEFSVGGLAVLYPNKHAASDFWLVLEKNKLQWGYHRDNPGILPPLGERFGKASDVSVETVRSRLAALDKVAKENNVKIAGFLLKSSTVSANNLTSTTAPDFVFRKLVSLAIEILLFEWLPLYERIMGKPISISVYVAKRSWVAPPSELINAQNNFGLVLHPMPSAKTDYCFLLDDEAVREHWLELKDDVGFLRSKDAVTARTVTPESKKVKIAAYSFSFDSVHPLITDIFALRGAKKTVPAALGVGLPYNENQQLTPNQLSRQIHYAADYVVSCPEAVPAEWWANGFEDLVDQTFEYVLHASRACEDLSQRVKAIAEWETGRLFTKPARNSFARWVGRRVSDYSRQMRGEEFIWLCELLAKVAVPSEVYVGNLAFSWTEDMLGRAFVREDFQVLGVKIVKDFLTKQSKGFGFVMLVNERQAEVASLKMNGAILGGRALVVRVAKQGARTRRV